MYCTILEEMFLTLCGCGMLDENIALCTGFATVSFFNRADRTILFRSDETSEAARSGAFLAVCGMEGENNSNYLGPVVPTPEVRMGC